MSNQQRLRWLINSLPGETWGDKVGECARIACRSESLVYKWLSDKPEVSDIMLDALELRIQKLAAMHDSTDMLSS